MSATQPSFAPVRTLDRVWRGVSWHLCIGSALAATVSWISWMGSHAPLQATIAACLTLLAVASVDATLFADRATRARLGFAACRPAAALAIVAAMLAGCQMFDFL